MPKFAFPGPGRLLVGLVCVLCALPLTARAQEDGPPERVAPPRALEGRKRPSEDAKPAPKTDAYVLPAGETHDGDLTVVRRSAEIRGTLKGCLLAVESRVTLRKSAVVTGSVVRLGDSPLTQEEGAEVGGASLQFALPSELNATPFPAAPARTPAKKKDSYGDWVGGQVFFLVCGLGAGLLALVIAPRASLLAVAALDSEPGRCLAVGVAGMLLLGLLNVVNWILCFTGIWIPIGVVVMLLSLLIVLYSGLLGVAYVGGHAKRGGRPPKGFYRRLALGLVLFAFVNSIPGFNIVSLLLETVVFVMGLGALFVTGFGRSPVWLAERLAHASRFADPKEG